MIDIMLQWFVDCVISVLALAGYVTYYNQLLNGDAAHRGMRIDAMILGVAIGLQVAQWIDPARMKVYANLQLLVLAFPLLGSDINRRHLMVRFIGLAGFTALNHPGLIWWQYGVGILGQVVIVGLMQRFYAPLRAHFSLNTLIMLVLVVGYWLPRDDIAVSGRVGLVVTYLVISGVNFWYWLALRKADNRYSQLAHQVDFDPLTNAASFALFRQNATHAFAVAKNAQAPLTVMILDIDYFKRINDHWGHPVGDAVLIAALHRLESVLKPAHARIYRTGGEEFTVLLPNYTVKQAQPLAVACCQVMRQTPLDTGEQKIAVTISMGVDAISALDTDFDTLYSRVDADLYRSKARGRDTVTIAGKTLWRHDRLTVSHFFAEYTQPVYQLSDQLPLSCAMMADYWTETVKDWVPAERFHMALAAALDFLQAAAKTTKQTQVDLDVTSAQFGDPRLLPKLSQWLAVHPHVHQLRLILTDPPSPAVLSVLAPGFNQAHCQLLLHPKPNTAWLSCLAHVSGLVIETKSDAASFQQTVVQAANKTLTPIFVRQIDNEQAFAAWSQTAAVQASGAYFGRPILPQVVARTNRQQRDESN